METNEHAVSDMVVKIIDFYGVGDEYPVIETGKVPEGYQYEPDFGVGGKVKVVFLNSRGRKEVSVVNHNHIQLSLKAIQEIKRKAKG